MKVIKVILFTVVQIPLLPLFILGFIMVGTKQILGSKKLGLSGTAIDILQSRWIQHYFGGRKDPLTIELAKTLPNMSHVGMCLAISGVAIAHRLFSFTPGMFSVARKGEENNLNFFYTRHLFFDSAFEKHLDDMEQVVLMGAGFDTRSFTYCRKDGLLVFELDQMNMQHVKRDALKKAGVDSTFIRFVPVDFSCEEWHEKLLAAGFERGKRTLFLWEGVTLYLEESEVRATLQLVSEIAAPGSIIALDLYSLSFVEWAKKRGEVVYKNTTGETFHFGLDLSADVNNSVEAFLSSVNLRLGRMETCGEKRKGKEPIVALIEARVG